MIDPVFQSQSIMVHSFYRSKHIFKPKSYVGNPSKIAICLMSFASLCLFSNRAPCKLRFEFYVHLCWSFMHRNPRATLLFLEEFQTELFSLKISFDILVQIDFERPPQFTDRSARHRPPTFSSTRHVKVDLFY